MAKVALLIGVSNYCRDLSPLPAAIQDVKELARVLKHPEMGNFDEVQTLINANSQTIREAAENIFSQRKKDDLVLFFFSGHGIKDEYGKFYFAAPETYKNERGELVRASAVSALFIKDNMNRSRSKRQVVILDCCFSGAFGDRLSAKDDGVVDIESELGGEGRAVLTSSTSSQYSFEQQGADLSIYTRYLVEGIETGAADQDGDGVISTLELHKYVQRKVQAAAPAMKPKIFVAVEGFTISLALAPTQEPTLQYRREVEQIAQYGEISEVARKILDIRRAELEITKPQAAVIEAEVLEPYRKFQQNLNTYEQALRLALSRQNPISFRQQAELDRLQEILSLQDDDIQAIKAKVVLENGAASFARPQGNFQEKSSAVAATNKTPMPSKPNQVATPLPHRPAKPTINSVSPSSPSITLDTSAAKAKSQADSQHSRSTKPLLLVRIVGSILAIAVAGIAIKLLGVNPAPTRATTLSTASLNELNLASSHKQLMDQSTALVKLQQTLTIAWNHYTRGDLPQAIEALRGSSQFQDAQLRIELWPTEWSTNEALFREAREALAAEDWTYARQQANSINTSTEYWKEIQATLFAQIEPIEDKLTESEDDQTQDPENGAYIEISEDKCRELRTKYAQADPRTRNAVNTDVSTIRRLCKEYGIDFPG